MNKNPNTHTLLITINDKKYEWQQQYITGAELKKLAQVPTEDELFLSIKKPWQDEPIMDDTNVDLARPGIEHFYSKIPIAIIVNGREREWGKRKITYEEVVKLAFENHVENGVTAYTVTYSRGPVENPEGSMVKGDKVVVKNKMVFNVTATNKS